jgi:hypothetical protein
VFAQLETNAVKEVYIFSRDTLFKSADECFNILKKIFVAF